MRLSFFVMMMPALTAQVLSISPASITECTNGLGRATLSWNAPNVSKVQVRIGDPAGPPMTGISDSTGSATTGDWVTDGMVFVLATANTPIQSIATVQAVVNCGGTADTAGAALSASTAYQPLEVGNQWIFRVDSPAVTSSYNIQTLTGTTQVGDKTYFILETRTGDTGVLSQSLVRSDDRGRVYQLNTDTQTVTEQLLLDPTQVGQPEGSPVAVLSINDVVTTPAGQLPIGLGVKTSLVGSGEYARGLGLLYLYEADPNLFRDSLNLVESRVGEGLYFSTPANSVEVAAESRDLAVSSRQVTNCAVPCYTFTCVPVDPPGSFKPCFQARIRVGLGSCVAASQVVANLDFLDSSDDSLFSRAVGMTVPPKRCESAAYVQVPLYTGANQPIPAGTYRVSVKVMAGNDELGSASVPVQIH
jgi:hypothetical protein